MCMMLIKKRYVLCIKKMDFLIIFSGYIIPATSYGSKLCFIINLYFYITFVEEFYAIHSNDGTA